MKAKALVISVPNQDYLSWAGISENRQVVGKWTTFDGKEGVLGKYPNDHATGWYEPVEWMEEGEVLRLMVEWEADYLVGLLLPGQDYLSYAESYRAALEQLMKDESIMDCFRQEARDNYLGSPDCFPGLVENYKSVALQ